MVYETVGITSPSEEGVQRAVVITTAYFELFKYPLSAEEMHRFCELEIEKSRFFLILEGMRSSGRLVQDRGFYMSSFQPDWVDRRLECNARAERMTPKANKMACRIGRFPFVKAVFISGSLSKQVMAPDSDVDFFIVTAPGRLWLARTMLAIYKKIFLLNSRKYFCINYFIDSEHLEIEEKNRFTAVETATLLPCFGREYCRQFQSANGWTQDYLPNHPPRETACVPAGGPRLFKRTAEYLMGGFLGGFLDRLCMKSTVFFWRKKFRHFDDKTFSIALKSKPYVSKHHPQNFQKKVLEALEKKLAATL